MRVQATETTPSYSMGKSKKHKIRKTKEASDSSDDGSVPSCNHVNMSVNFAQMKKGLSKQTFGECASCNTGNKDSSSRPRSGDSMAASAMTTEDGLLGEVETTMWVCLQCGHQGCDRNSYEKHALKHYETPRSSSHCIAVNTSSWSTWCYKCDDTVPVEKNKKMLESVDHLRKQSGLPIIDSSAKRSSSFGASGSTSIEQVKETNRPLTPKGPTPGICHKLKGLSNLGNTCFFNAVMQNLTQTQCLENIVQERSKKGKSVNIDGKHLSDSDSSDEEEFNGDTRIMKEMPTIEIVLPEAGPLTQSMVSFLQEMNNSTSRSSTVNPSALFGQVCKKAQRFRGFQQQDSHELLRYLLDSMKMEEVKRSQAAILKHFKLHENVNPKKVPEETKFKIKEYGRLVKHTFVDSMFGGYLLSTVLCEECKHISQIFEPFLDLSLPVTEEKPPRPNQAQGIRKKDSVDKADDKTNAGTEGGRQYKATRPSKHEVKKQKRQAKKDAKKKVKFPQNKGTHDSGVVEQDCDGEDDPEGIGDEEDDDEEDNKKSEDQKTGEQDDNSSNKDDPSDADIEDNLESDTSKCFGVLGNDMDTSVSEPNVDKDMMNSKSSLQEKITDSPQSSSASTLQPDSHSSNVTDMPNTDSNHTLNEVVGTISLNGINEEVKNIKPTDIVKPKVITNATIDDVQGDLLNGYCNDDFHGDATFCNINGLENSTNLCNGMVDGVLKTQRPKSSELKGEGLCKNSSVENCNMKEHNSMLSATQQSPSSKSTNEVINNENGRIDENKADSLDAKLDNLTIKENGAVDPNELTSKLDNLDINCEKDRANNICSDKLEKNNSEDENTSKQGELSKQLDDENLQKITKNTKNSPPLSRQGSAKHSNVKKDLKKEAQFKSTTMLGTHYTPSSRECSVMSCLHQFTSAELLTGNNKFGCANCTKIRDKHHPNKENKEMVYSNASKYYLVYSPPPILTLHLKRFEQVGFTSRKVNRHVDFPFVLDLAPFCSFLCQGVKPCQKKILYSLYGVVEHSGRLNAGHYTAYVKVRPNIGIITNFLNQGLPSIKEYIERYSQSVVNGPREGEEEIDEVQEEKLVPPGRWYHISDSRVSEATESTVQRAQAYLLFYERIY